MAEPQHYPECEKLAAADPESRAILAFLDWLDSESLEIGEHTKNGFYPVKNSHSFIVAQYFDIDMKKVEAERCQMIADLRKN